LDHSAQQLCWYWYCP